MDKTFFGPQDSNWQSLYKIGGMAALLQLAAILTYTIALAVLGPKPASAEEFFTIQQSDRLASVLRVISCS